MRASDDPIERNGQAFGRAFECARQWGLDPDAPQQLRQAVGELVQSGAIFPLEAEVFEEALIARFGCAAPEARQG